MANWHLYHMWSADAHKTLGSHQRCQSNPWREARRKSLCLFVLFPNCSGWPDSFQGRLKKEIERDYFTDFRLKFILLTLQPPVALLSYLKEEDEGGTMVIWPMIVSYSSAKESICVICCSLRCVNYVVFIVMFSIQKICHLRKVKEFIQITLSFALLTLSIELRYRLSKPLDG